MTIASLARAAEVSPQTIYNSVGGKAAVVKALYDAGWPVTTIPCGWGSARSCSRFSISRRATTVRAYVALGRGLYSRVGPILGALLVDGPGATPSSKRS